ncbi:DUF2270 domain-containing protein [Halostella sp. JP-L12]|uniref:DUF2270 domain-containing protein n=1 Tax=Halostella TaxID=1843185 RepID=UPI000EF7BF84|nr:MULTISPECIES: DUF2270 domain-containing protein [Halostella]NHN49291.1 DUF2270 domain-containing protein [Halostella sp. JP-L12]
MSGSSSKDVDPTDPEQREVGQGLLDEEMGPSGSMAHLYRSENNRTQLWRQRLDRTTNWAVIVIAAILTWSFSNESNPHYVLLFGVGILGTLLVIEARRYRGYDVWRSRVRTLQRNVWAYGLDPSQGLEEQDWRAELSSDYRQPQLRITMEEAIAHRLRRVYLPLVTIMLGAWVVRITAFTDLPVPASAAIGEMSGFLVIAIVVISYAVLLVIAVRPRTWYAETELKDEDLRQR